MEIIIEDGLEKVSGPGGTHQKNWTHLNNNNSELPLDMRFNHGHMVSIIVYSILMVISATGNLTVLSQLLKRRRAGRASRLDVLLMHLAVADLMVTFLMMPLEIAWAGTVQWLAGDLMCRFMMFTRTFGLYLSSFVLICIAVDRYYAILKPLCLTWEASSRRALGFAWIFAVVASVPQCIIFHLGEHPEVKGYFQCVSYGSLPTASHEFAYFLVNMILMYVAPLLSTLYCSSAALLEIVRRANTSNDALEHTLFVCQEFHALGEELAHSIDTMLSTNNMIDVMLSSEDHWDQVLRHITSIMKAKEEKERIIKQRETTRQLSEALTSKSTQKDLMRRSGVGILGRARARTLKMTVTIVIVFFACWSPYYCYCIWYWVDKDTVKNLDPAFQKILWLFSCTNSCANPIVYGIFNKNRWKFRETYTTRYSSNRRGSRLPYGESMEISAATLARARSSMTHHDRNSVTVRRDSNFSAVSAKNGTNKHINNNNVNGIV